MTETPTRQVAAPNQSYRSGVFLSTSQPFAVIAGNVNEPVMLELTGSEEAKAFPRTELQSKIDVIANET